MKLTHLIIVTVIAAGIGACGKTPVVSQADVIVVGAGIAGLSAALEASDNGAKVIVLDANSVGGGHAVMAGGLAMVDTQLQRDKGINDSPLQAEQDMLAWGGNADPYWVKRYAQESGSEVYDWLTALGVEFKMVLPTPESKTPRFHFTKGTAVHVVLPLLREALSRDNINFVWSTAADSLLMYEDRVVGVHANNLRSNSPLQLYGNSVILATGGFQNNLEMVRKNWSVMRDLPATLLLGAGQFATGDGYALASGAGAKLQRMDHQVTFVNGIANPRTPGKGLTVTHRQAMLINGDAKRFVDESAPAKNKERAVLEDNNSKVYLVFDASGSKKLGVRGAHWLNTDTVRNEILENPQLTVKADSIKKLAEALQVQAETLRYSIDEYNGGSTKPVTQAPFYALRLHALTRKSMGGPVINEMGRVLDQDQNPIAGLYAAGELTGVAGINGSYGGSGTFLGPSVLLGRIAGKNAATEPDFQTSDPDPNIESTPAITARADGYWHYETAHTVVHENQIACETCHNPKGTPMREVGTNQQMLNRLQTCLHCH